MPYDTKEGTKGTPIYHKWIYNFVRDQYCGKCMYGTCSVFFYSKFDPILFYTHDIKLMITYKLRCQQTTDSHVETYIVPRPWSLNRTNGKDSRVRLRTNSLSITCCAILCSLQRIAIWSGAVGLSHVERWGLGSLIVRIRKVLFFSLFSKFSFLSFVF